MNKPFDIQCHMRVGEGVVLTAEGWHIHRYGHTHTYISQEVLYSAYICTHKGTRCWENQVKTI